MRRRTRRSTTIPVLAILGLLLAAASVRADQVLGFPNGLAGWSTVGDSGTVTAAGGLATIAESSVAAETDLFLTFNVPSGIQSLQFTLNSVAPDSTVENNTNNGYLPDFLGASLLNPSTLVSLVPTVDATTDSFYIRDVVEGVTQGQAATGVTVTTPPGLVAVISVDLSSLNLTGQDAEILFRLAGGTDPDSSSSVTISDVILVGGAAVPEPSTMILGILGGLVSCGYYRQCCRRPRDRTRPAAP